MYEVSTVKNDSDQYINYISNFDQYFQYSMIIASSNFQWKVLILIVKM